MSLLSKDFDRVSKNFNAEAEIGKEDFRCVQLNPV